MTRFSQAIQEFPLVRWLSDKGITVGDTGNIRINCPHCSGRRTLSIDPRRKLCQCFKCSEGGAGGAVWSGQGSLVDIIAIIAGVSRHDAIHEIYRLSGVTDYELRAVESPEKPANLIPPEAIPLLEVSSSHPSVVNLRRRGLAHLLPHIFVAERGQYSSRWILPCQYLGVLEGIEAKGYGNSRPKSLYPEWFKTSTTVYTTRIWRSDLDYAVITESIFDAETLTVNAIGLYGSAIRTGQVEKLLELRASGVTRLVWFLDEDAWQKQADSILSRTSIFFNNYVVDVPYGQDPNSLGHVRCWDLVRQARLVRSSPELFAIRM